MSTTKQEAELVVIVDDVPVRVPSYATVAAALTIAYGRDGTRRSVTGEARAALCAMGVCQECRVSIDGRHHVLACQTLCRHGMSIVTEHDPR